MSENGVQKTEPQVSCESARAGTIRVGKSGRNTGGRGVPRPPGSHQRRKRRKPSRFRVLLWIVELTLLAAVIEHFLIRPHLAERGSAPSGSSEVRRSVKHGDPVAALGDSARDLRGLTEVVPAFSAYMPGLAEGSEVARATQQLVSQQLALPVEVENTLSMRFRLVPSGTFLVGSPDAEQGRWVGEAEHVVSISQPFYMGKFELRQREWDAVMLSADVTPAAATGGSARNPSYFRGPEHPVEEVTWYDCQRFTVALCERESVPIGTYRLPTENEWEYACRAGTATAYCFGDDPARLGSYADYEGNNYRGTNAVGRRLPNAYGLHDMHGNVWEWCLERFGAYKGRASGKDVPDGDWRVIRGGNWHDSAKNCRSANRCRLPPGSHGNLLGLRLVRVLPELTAVEAEKVKREPGAAPASPGNVTVRDTLVMPANGQEH